jgi:hypothetical protein
VGYLVVHRVVHQVVGGDTSSEQARLLRFAIKYPGWQGYSPRVSRVVHGLVKWGLLEVNEFKQFRLVRLGG